MWQLKPLFVFLIIATKPSQGLYNKRKSFCFSKYQQSQSKVQIELWVCKDVQSLHTIYFVVTPETPERSCSPFLSMAVNSDMFLQTGILMMIRVQFLVITEPELAKPKLHNGYEMAVYIYTYMKPWIVHTVVDDVVSIVPSCSQYLYYTILFDKKSSFFLLYDIFFAMFLRASLPYWYETPRPWKCASSSRVQTSNIICYTIFLLAKIWLYIRFF